MSELSTPQSPVIQLISRGGLYIMIPPPEIENLPSNLIEPAAQTVMGKLRDHASSNLIVDLSKVSYFGSEFISFLLRCHLLVKKQDCELVLAGVSPRIRELLRQTALDTLWAIYDDTNQAIDALGLD